MTSHGINPALIYPPYYFDCLRLQSGWKPAAAETPPEVYQLHSSGVRGCLQISLTIFFMDTANAFPTHGGNIRGTYNWQLYRDAHTSLTSVFPVSSSCFNCGSSLASKKLKEIV